MFHLSQMISTNDDDDDELNLGREPTQLTRKVNLCNLSNRERYFMIVNS